jgi:co-chaperonin GroES (HSP10)
MSNGPFNVSYDNAIVVAAKEISDKGQKENWAIIKGQYALNPKEDRLLVLEDGYKSRFDCGKCGGKKHLGEMCHYCGGTKMYKGSPCRDCEVASAKTDNYIGGTESLGFVPCDQCKGQGGTIVIPDDSQKNSTTGNILAVGDKVHIYHVGEKIMFTSFTGSPFIFLDMSLRIINEKDVLCSVKQLKANVEGLNEGRFADLDNTGVAHQ